MIKDYIICVDCGLYAYVFRASALTRLPTDYTGELCPQCGLWMCAVDKLETTDGATEAAPSEDETITQKTSNSQPAESDRRVTVTKNRK